MRNLLITLVVLGALAAGYVFLSKNARLSFSSLQGETQKVHRGDLIVPINASGNIQPASVTSGKSKASGEVKEIPFDVGEKVDLPTAKANVHNREGQLSRAKVAKDFQDDLKKRSPKDVTKFAEEEVDA